MIEILIAVILIIIIGLVLLKFSKSNPLTPQANLKALPPEITPNDKIIIIRNITDSQIKTVITNFCTLYNEETYDAVIELHKLGQNNFAITCPYDMDYLIFCFLVNYLYYPNSMKDWQPEVSAWLTLPEDGGPGAGRKAELFIPKEDTQHDNIYIRFEGGACYKYSLDANAQDRIPAEISCAYNPPRIAAGNTGDTGEIFY